MEEFVTQKLLLTTETEDSSNTELGFGYVSPEAFDEGEWDIIELGYARAEGALEGEKKENKSCEASNQWVNAFLESLTSVD